MPSFHQALRVSTLCLLPLAAMTGHAFAQSGRATPVPTQSSSSPTFSNPINQPVPPATSTLNRHGVPPYRLPQRRRH